MKTAHLLPVALAVFLVTPGAWASLWSTPELLDDIQTVAGEGAPFPTYDGLSFYYSRQVSGTGSLLSAPLVNLASAEQLSVNAGGSVIYGWVSEDNLRLYYSESFSNGDRVINMSTRALDTADWTAGSGLSTVNALGPVVNPSLSRDELTIVFARPVVIPGSSTTWDLWMGTRADKGDDFTVFANVSLANSDASDLHPRLSADGLTLYFTSNRNGSDWELFQATWSDATSSFGAATPLSFFNSPGFSLQYPALSADGMDFYFAQAPTGSSDYDIYVSHVVPAPGAVVLGIIGLSYAGWRCRRRTV